MDPVFFTMNNQCGFPLHKYQTSAHCFHEFLIDECFFRTTNLSMNVRYVLNLFFEKNLFPDENDAKRENKTIKINDFLDHQ